MHRRCENLVRAYVEQILREQHVPKQFRRPDDRRRQPSRHRCVHTLVADRAKSHTRTCCVRVFHTSVRAV